MGPSGSLDKIESLARDILCTIQKSTVSILPRRERLITNIYNTNENSDTKLY